MSDSNSDFSQNSDSDSRLLTITLMKFGCQQFCNYEHSMEIVVDSKNSLFQ